MRRKSILLLWLCLFSLWAVAQERKIVKIACVGNSITYGSGIKNQFQTVIRDCFPNFWAKDMTFVISESVVAYC